MNRMESQRQSAFDLYVQVNFVLASFYKDELII
jgi:hypothetical protein